MRRPSYVPPGSVYVSTNRVKRRHGERRRRSWLVILACLAAIIALSVSVVALAHLDREASAGWPQPGRNVHTIPAPGRTGGVGAP